MQMDMKMLTTRETAYCLGCSESIVYNLIRTGKLPAYKDPDHRPWRIPESSVIAYRDERLAQFTHQSKRL